MSNYPPGVSDAHPYFNPPICSKCGYELDEDNNCPDCAERDAIGKGWQPIESAPSDDRPILLTVQDDNYDRRVWLFGTAQDAEQFGAEVWMPIPSEFPQVKEGE